MRPGEKRGWMTYESRMSDIKHLEAYPGIPKTTNELSLYVLVQTPVVMLEIVQ